MLVVQAEGHAVVLALRGLRLRVPETRQVRQVRQIGGDVLGPREVDGVDLGLGGRVSGGPKHSYAYYARVTGTVRSVENERGGAGSDVPRGCSRSRLGCGGGWARAAARTSLARRRASCGRTAPSVNSACGEER